MNSYLDEIAIKIKFNYDPSYYLHPNTNVYTYLTEWFFGMIFSHNLTFSLLYQQLCNLITI